MQPRGWQGHVVYFGSLVRSRSPYLNDIFESKRQNADSEAEFKGKHGVWDPMPELIITSPNVVDAKVDSDTFTMGNPMPESTLTLCQSRRYPPVRDLGFGLCVLGMMPNPVS